MILKQILIQLNKTFLNLDISTLKLTNLFNLLLIGNLFVFELFPKFGNEFLEFEVFFPDNTLADLLVGWHGLGAWSAAGDAL